MLAPTTVTAQPVPADEPAPEVAGAEGTEETVEDDATEAADPPPPALPSDPVERLELARSAFMRADYGLLVPLLQPMDADDELLASLDDRVASRELLGVGYFFLAQQTTNATVRTQMMDAARQVYLRLLRSKPDHALDQLLFPASVVELFEDVRAAHAEELDEILRSRDEGPPAGELETLYIERAATLGVYWLNFLPFGIGQFQNGQVAKGTAFALLQGAGLAFNVTSYWSIVRLMNDEGRFAGAPNDQNSSFANALRWRRNLYIGLGAFAGLWILGIIDSLANYEPERVRIRTLDAPPPELAPNGAGAGLDLALPLGLSIEFDW